ncbi:electron transport complex subunit G [Vibrio zhanjiangensis]|uniref:Ion-translocating oxidoreductase complex subunit G n=1 Tax=Vibrio zhanjiangensis TaxID=1046128 RepID=A0ABQ6ETL7_9VIBR|nr:electron transport complex subunit RsxG [Vibrio zhanjiangensis]GLT16401.1 electron transport complex subunit G [Vibrio zhanjiangensis]
MLNAIRKNGAILALFACASTGVVALTHYLTKQQIGQQEQAQLLSVLNQVIPENMHDNNLYQSCTLVNHPDLGTDSDMPVYLASKDGQPTALAIEAIAPDGYNGAIKIIIGMKHDGTILGTRVLNHQETPGLGDKIDLRITDWILSFSGKKVTQDSESQWKVRKDGGQFDQFTGATITPRAVVKAIKKAAQFVNSHSDEIQNQPRNCGE